MSNRNLNIFIFAKEYLLSIDGITNEMIDAHLSEWKKKKPSDISKLFEAMIMHAQNRQGMPNSIGDIQKLRGSLFNFFPVDVRNNYQSWEDIFDAIQGSNYSPPGRMQKDNRKNYWVIFCKSIISIAEFLSKYRDIGEFNQFVEGFYTNEYSRLALPLLLENEIFGYGFALACDFLKESGYPEFIKPDTHINDIAFGIGITKSNSDFQIFKDVIKYCRDIDKVPYEVDKLFWLVGSGRFYLYNVEVQTSKDDFIELVNQKYPKN